MLTEKDNAVLGALFDAEASLNRINPTIIHKPTTDGASAVQREQVLEAVKLLDHVEPNPEAVRQSIDILNDVISNDPLCASAYANRAQAVRLLPQSVETLSQILQDLERAIQLAEPKSKLGAVTAENARVLSSAYTHRGYLFMKASTTPSFLESMQAVSSRYDGMLQQDFESLASRDFSIAGRYGNRIAQSLAIKTNPYAKLCGSVVREALQKEISDFSVMGRRIA